jgi:hypothetical protein
MRHAYLLATAIVLAACASSGTSGTATAATASNSAHLKSEEFATSGLPTAYDLVERMRRPWLRRDPLTGADVTIYLDDKPLGGAEALRQIPSVEVSGMELVPNSQAQLRWGTSVKGSVIIVKKKVGE